MTFDMRRSSASR